MNMIIPNDVLTILEKLEHNGYEAYVVGGCVRDTPVSYTHLGDIYRCANMIVEKYKKAENKVFAGTTKMCIRDSNTTIWIS